jgi:Holliday junction resolvasome RuvABC endonuclease subunit
MKTIKIAGVDPAMRNLGLALAEYDVISHLWQVTHIKLVQTALDKNTLKTVRKSSEDLRCAQQLHRGVQEFFEEHNPAFFMGEVPVGAQSARAAFSNGICYGVLGALPTALIQVSPAEVQKSVLGYRGKDKDAMIDWATKKWPDLPWKRRKLRGQMVLTADNEHMADACGAIAAGVLTEEFKQVLAFARANL